MGNFCSADHIAEDNIHTDIARNIGEPEQKYRLGMVSHLFSFFEIFVSKGLVKPQKTTNQLTEVKTYIYHVNPDAAKSIS